jgi:hypothetical protein
VQRIRIFEVEADCCGALHLRKTLHHENLQTFRGSAAFPISSKPYSTFFNHRINLKPLVCTCKKVSPFQKVKPLKTNAPLKLKGRL